jgi:hypothetical protein
MLGVWFWPLILKNVLKVIIPKRTSIFPLGVANAIAFADCKPAIFAD